MQGGTLHTAITVYIPWFLPENQDCEKFGTKDWSQNERLVA